MEQLWTYLVLKVASTNEDDGAGEDEDDGAGEDEEDGMDEDEEYGTNTAWPKMRWQAWLRIRVRRERGRRRW
jgi:hypothetical protein